MRTASGRDPRPHVRQPWVTAGTNALANGQLGYQYPLGKTGMHSMLGTPRNPIPAPAATAPRRCLVTHARILHV